MAQPFHSIVLPDSPSTREIHVEALQAPARTDTHCGTGEKKEEGANKNWPGSLRSTPFLALVPRCSIYILDYEQRWVKSITNL